MKDEKKAAMPEFTNEEVEKAIKQFLDEKTNENMRDFWFRQISRQILKSR